MNTGLTVEFHDGGVLIGIEGRRALHLPVDMAVSVPDALRGCVADRRERTGPCWAVAPDRDGGDGVVFLFAAEIGGETVALPLRAVTAEALAAAILRAVDERAILVVHDDDIQNAAPDDFRR